MLGKITAVQKDHKAFFVELECPSDFKMGEIINLSKTKKKRTLKQNALWWCYLTWLIHPFGGDLQSQGHFSTDALHQDVKAWIEASHSHDFPIDKKFTTTELDKKEFGRFFDMVNEELMVEILGVDTSGFWKEYERYSQWAEYNREDFQGYMDEQKLPF